MSDSKSTSGGIGFTSLLAIVFITLKLTNVIDWSWWWVLSPLWIPAVILAIAFIIVFAVISLKREKKKPEVPSVTEALDKYRDAIK